MKKYTYETAHEEIDYIFKALLSQRGMAERPEQIRLCHSILDAMLDGSIALCDAGTGIGKTFTGVFPGSLLLSIPEQPSLFMLASALCLIICPDSVSAGGAANAAPAQVKSLAAGSCKASHGSWRTLRGSLFCPGGYPYCWYAIFKEQRGAIRSPSLSSRKLRSVNTLISRNFQKTF